MTNTGMPKVVLVADDDADIREIVCSAISIMGNIPIPAADGRQALERIQEAELDLLILDVMMPHMTGLEVCEQYKRTERGRLTPVLILTARDTIQDKVEAFEDGADDYLTKPFNFKELQARVKALLRVREMNIALQEKNRELQRMQQKLVEQERQLAVTQLAGTAAHKLGQPLSALLLNVHLLESLRAEDSKREQVLQALKVDLKRMASMIESLKSTDANEKSDYYQDLDILQMKD